MPRRIDSPIGLPRGPPRLHPGQRSCNMSVTCDGEMPLQPRGMATTASAPGHGPSHHDPGLARGVPGAHSDSLIVVGTPLGMRPPTQPCNPHSATHSPAAIGTSLGIRPSSPSAVTAVFGPAVGTLQALTYLTR